MEIITKTNGYCDGEAASCVYIVSFSEKEQDYLQRCKFFHQVCSDRKHFDYNSESEYLEEKEEFEYLTPEASETVAIFVSILFILVGLKTDVVSHD